MDLTQAQNYAIRQLEARLPAHLVYHSLEHMMEEVPTAARGYARALGLDETQQALVMTAAYFHDLGFLQHAQGHEEVGAQIVAEVLPGMGYQPDHIVQIQGMIRATRLPQSPHTALEAILCDADLDSLGREDFMARSDLLRLENAVNGQRVSDPQWFASQWAFLCDHEYHTSAARELRNLGKQHNLQLLLERIEALHRSCSCAKRRPSDAQAVP